jgi:hypothetical protein
MASSSARPRIESVANFVLTVDAPPEDPPAECLTFDEDISPPTITEVGSASGSGDGDWDIVLSDDATGTTETDSYILVVAILSQGCSIPGIVTTVLNHGDTFTVTDDSAEPVPSYLQLDGFDCFNPAWRHKTLLDGSPHGDHFQACVDTPPDVAGMQFNWTGHIAYRALTNPLPAGTTVTVNMSHSSDDPGAGIAYEMHALLIKNMAPYTGSIEYMDDSQQVDAFDEGGVLFTFSAGSNTVPDEGSCSFFIGTKAEGTARHVEEGDSVCGMAESVYVQEWHPSDGPPCFCTDNTRSDDARIRAVTIAPGGGTFTADTGSLLLGFDLDCISGIMLPGQGFY